ncbi:MAG: DUF5658 family protein [bacterium]
MEITLTTPPKKLKKLLTYMALLMLVDYLLTYFGIHMLECISEANPFMRYFMEFPFILGLPLRLIYISIPISLLYLAYEYAENKKILFNVIYGLILIQFIPLGLHILWMIQFAQFTL